MPRADRGDAADQRAAEAFVAAADAHDRPVERVRVVDVRRAGGGEVALIGEVRALRDTARRSRARESGS